MLLKRSILKLCLLLVLCCSCLTSAYAVSFADFAYEKAAKNQINQLRPYLRKGLRIDLPNSEGDTALCQAVKKNNYTAYIKLRRLGANPQHPCMQKVNTETAKSFTEHYNSRDFSYTTTVTNDNSTLKYAGMGLLAAGAAVGAVALFDDDNSSHHKSSACPQGSTHINGECRPISCESGTHLVNGKCEPLNCPEGTIVDGNGCRPVSGCPVGQTWNGSECVDIVCPENTHLQGNSCVANDFTITNNTDDDVIAINSDSNNVFNLLSTPSYPKSNAQIEIENNGNGNVTGMQGISNIYNALVVKDDGEYTNPQPNGKATIKITDNGSGTVRGIYAKIEDITQYKQAINATSENSGTAYGTIDITHTGGGDTYGIMGDVRAYNAYGAYGGTSYGDIKIHGDGDIYGISGYVAATNAVSPYFGHKVVGNINLYGNGNGNIYGMMINKDDIPGAGTGGGNLASWFAFNAYASGGDYVEGNINIRNPGNGNAYGMYGGQQLYNTMPAGRDEAGNPTSTARGTINILNSGNGDAYGMYIPDADPNAIIANIGTDGATSIINIVNTGTGTATGMRGGQETFITNSGEININNLGSGTAIGMYGEENSRIDNSGTINITHQTYEDPETGQIYRPDTTHSGTAYGIYAEKGATVVNNGNITITGAESGQGIFLEEGATLTNNGNISFNGRNENNLYTTANSGYTNLNDFGGEIILGNNGKFFADHLTGNLSVSENTVMNNFADTYILEKSIQAENIDDLKLKSKSAMFKAETKANENDSYDVVMTRQNFNSLISDKAVAEFLENNYQNENGLEIYNTLKQSETNQDLNRTTANLHGTDVIPSFRQEDALVYHHLSRQFNDNLFNHPENNYIGGYKYMDISMDNTGTLVGSDGKANAAYGMLTGKSSGGLTYGLGASAANLKSDYDNGSDRKSNIFGLWLPLGYNFQNGTQWFSKAYLGYADGSYNRQTSLGRFSGDTKEYQYGLGNEVRYKMDLGNGISFEPTAELSLLGIYQDSINEGNKLGALHIDSNNSLSLEGGLGAYLGKKFNLSDNGSLGIQIGGVYYVEFLDPDDGMNAAMSGMDGKYKLKNKIQSDRALLSLRLNYEYKDVTLYGSIEKETNNNKALTIDAGLQYKF